MHANNNQSIIKRISKRSIQANKTRNIFAVLAIILTTFMISTVFSIGISFAENFAIMSTRTAGTTATIFLNNPTEEQYNKIKELDYIEVVGTGISIGSIKTDKDANISMFSYDKNQWENQITPAISDINGAYPTQADEIMLSVEALNQLGITNPKKDMEIPLTYVTQNGETAKTFHLSGWFTNYKDFGSGGIPVALLSKEYSEKNGYTLEDSGTISITTKPGEQDAVYEKLLQDIPLEGAQTFDTTFDPSEENTQTTSATLIVIGLIAIFIVLSGYLLIYNVMYISVTKDIRFYGMLKTIGASPKQIKKIVRSQMYRLSLLAIPVGLILSIATSFGTVPMAMKMFQDGSVYGAMPSDVSFHPMIFIGTAIFAFLTVFLSCRKPAKMAGTVSPIEALRYTGVSKKKKEKDRKSTKGGKLYRMAFYQVFRDKKKAFLVFASLIMGIITLLSFTGFFNSLKVENYIETYYPRDFSYQSLEPLSEEKFDDHFMTELSKIDGITNIDIIKSTRAGVVFDEEVLKPVLKRAYYDNPYGPAKEYFATYEEFVSSLETMDDYGSLLLAIDDSYVEAYNKTHENQIDIEAFQRGEIVIIPSYDDKNMTDMIGRDIILKENNTDKKTAVTIGGVFGNDDFSGNLYSYSPGEISAIYVSKTFMDNFTDNAQITFIDIDVESSKEPAIKAQLKNMNANLASSDYVFTAQSDVMADFQSTMTSMNVLSGGISILLIVIGILNFVNVMLTGVYIRRKELAVMESVGMTKKQIHKMLTFEGLYYALITTVLIMTLGNGILYGVSVLSSKIADYAVFTYPTTLMITLVVMIFLICLIVPNIIYRITAKESVIERIRDREN